MSDLDFNVLDQQYLHRDVVQQETVKMLAQLELETHRLRMQMVLAGSGEAKTQNGQTYNEALAGLDKGFTALKAKFADALGPADAGTQ